MIRLPVHFQAYNGRNVRYARRALSIMPALKVSQEKFSRILRNFVRAKQLNEVQYSENILYRSNRIPV